MRKLFSLNFLSKFYFFPHVLHPTVTHAKRLELPKNEIFIPLPRNAKAKSRYLERKRASGRTLNRITSSKSRKEMIRATARKGLEDTRPPILTRSTSTSLFAWPPDLIVALLLFPFFWPRCDRRAGGR